VGLFTVTVTAEDPDARSVKDLANASGRFALTKLRNRGLIVASDADSSGISRLSSSLTRRDVTLTPRYSLAIFLQLKRVVSARARV